MAEIHGIVGIGPLHKASAQTGQLAQFLFERIKIVEFDDIVRCRARNPGLHQLLFRGCEDLLSGLKAIEQQTAYARADAMCASQCKPVCVRGWSNRGYRVSGARAEFAVRRDRRFCVYTYEASRAMGVDTSKSRP